VDTALGAIFTTLLFLCNLWMYLIQFFLGKPFQPSVMYKYSLLGKFISYKNWNIVNTVPRVTLTKLYFLRNFQMDQITTLGWKGLPGTNTLTLWNHLLVTNKMKCAPNKPERYTTLGLKGLPQKNIIVQKCPGSFIFFITFKWTQ
jgi:hypothetical protein